MPMPLDRFVEAFRPAEVVPQPRYPAEVSSFGATLPAMPGSVGSLFGLKPYSSTSFRRSSSAALLALRLRQKKIAARMIKATETTGTTTATAMVPLGDKPPPPEAAAVADDNAAESVAVEEPPVEAVLVAIVPDSVEVT